MKIELTSEQVALQETLRQMFAKECPTTLVRELREPGSPGRTDALWSALADVGLFGLPFAERWGGFGQGLFELGLAYQEAGRALCPTLVYSTLAFGLAVDALGSDAQRGAWLPKLAAGQLAATTALWDPGNAGDLAPRIKAARQDDGWRLSGTLDFVLNADVSDVLLVSAVDDAGTARGFLLTPGAAGLAIERHRTHAGDIQCKLTFVDVAVAQGDAVLALDPLALRQLADSVTALQCMEMLGGAQAALDITVAYVTVRHQFGRALGAFPAVQHRIADSRIAIDAARLTAWHAVWTAGLGRPAQRAAVIAKLHANEAYTFTTLTAHILWGGMGFMTMTDLHLYSSRAKAAQLLGGSRDVLLGRLEGVLELA